ISPHVNRLGCLIRPRRATRSLVYRIVPSNLVSAQAAPHLIECGIAKTVRVLIPRVTAVAQSKRRIRVLTSIIGCLDKVFVACLPCAAARRVAPYHPGSATQIDTGEDQIVVLDECVVVDFKTSNAALPLA